MKVPRQLPTVVLLFFYNMITKEEIVEMLSNENAIIDYEKYRYNIESKRWEPITRDDIFTMIYCINAYDRVIQHILSKLDEIDTPTDT